MDRFRLFGAFCLLSGMISAPAFSAECQIDRHGNRYCDRAPADDGWAGEAKEAARGSARDDQVCTVQPFGGGITCKKKVDYGQCHYDGMMERCYGRPQDAQGKYCFFDGLMERCLDRNPAHAKPI